MNHLELGAIFFPLAAYFLLLGALNSGRRPVLASGPLDLGALLLGLSGLIVAVPGRYLLQAGSLKHYGMGAWGLLGVGLVLGAGLLVRRQRRRWVVYNISEADFRDALKRAGEAAGIALEVGQRHIGWAAVGGELRVDVAPLGQNVSVELSAGGVPRESWKQLRGALKQALEGVTSRRNQAGRVFTLVGLVLGVAPLGLMGDHVQLVARNLQAALLRIIHSW